MVEYRHIMHGLVGEAAPKRTTVPDPMAHLAGMLEQLPILAQPAAPTTTIGILKQVNILQKLKKHVDNISNVVYYNI